MRARRAINAVNARPKKITVRHAGGSRALMHGPLDMRSSLGKFYRASIQALRQHAGGEALVSTPQAALIEQAARLALLEGVSWAEVLREGPMSPAVQVFLRAAADRRDVLKLLGLQRRTKPVPSLEEYLDGAKP